MTTDTKLQKLIINKLTTSEYSSINEKDPNQLYLVTDALGFDNTITNCLTHIPQDIKIEISDFSQGPYYGWINEDLSGYWTDTETPQVGGKLFLPNGQPTDASVFYEDTNATIVSYDPVGNTIEIEYRNLEEGTSITITTPRNSSYDVAGISEKKLVSKAGSKVWIPYGTTEAYKVGDTDAYGNTVVATSWDGAKFFYAIELQSDTSQNFSRTDTSKRLVFMELNTSLSGAVNMGSGTSPVNDTLYYRTDNNTIGYYMSDGSFIQTSLPLGVCVADGTYMFGSIDQVFNGFGYIGSSVFALPGVRGLSPNGRNTDGSLKNIEFEIDKVFVSNSFGTNSTNMYVFYNPDDNTMFRAYQYFEQTSAPNIDTVSNPIAVWYNPDENLFRQLWKNSGINEWTLKKIVNIGVITTDSSNKVSSLKFKNTFQAVDYNDFLNTPRIVETYRNGASWYRIYSDGWCEQGGSIVVSNTSQSGYAYSTATLTLLKPLANLISWNCTSKHDAFLSGFGFNSPGSSATTVTVYQKNVTESSYVNPFVIWVARGYIA